jgi:hypothetical protein
MTGVAPAGLLSGGPEVFDALIERAQERRRSGYEPVELLAELVEITHALLRVTAHAHGARGVPDQVKVRRPRHVDGGVPAMTARELAAALSGAPDVSGGGVPSAPSAGSSARSGGSVSQPSARSTRSSVRTEGHRGN